MLEELKNLDYHGGKAGLLYFICDVVGYGHISTRDADVICSHAPGRMSLSVSDLATYCGAFGWIQVSTDELSVSPVVLPYVDNKDELNDWLIRSTVNKLFAEQAFDANMFCYDAVNRCYAFKNELFPLALSVVRNVLISQGFITTLREDQGSRFLISMEYAPLLASHCKTRRKQISLERLRRQIERNEEAGDLAERFALAFEKRRIGAPLSEEIRRISEIDVAAGYDIVSFDTDKSTEPDRFIEVKAASDAGFFWSKNEYETAKLKGESYYLYLVELSMIDKEGYEPEMIKDPAKSIMTSDEWFVEARSFFIKRV
jgi:hypothetical protein